MTRNVEMFRLLVDHDCEWKQAGSCKGHDPELFYGDRGSKNYQEAIQICAACPVKDRCLEYALANGEKHGVWGGRTERWRRVERRRRFAAAGYKTALKDAS